MRTLWILMQRWLIGILLLLGVNSCVEPYAPEVTTAANNYLVVSGFINGNGSTAIRLSRSVQLAAPATFPAEARAIVTVESLRGQRYPLPETDTAGLYRSVRRLALPPNEQYRLHIRTAGGREYASDYTLLKHTPALDRFEGQIQANGLQIYVSAHDEQAQTRYYRWEYEETWAFTSAHWSRWRFSKGTPQRRTYFPRKEDIYHCWRTEPSTTVITTSTVRLSQDAVRDYRLLFIPAFSGRLQSLYSLRVRQYALSAEEFDYWEAVKKNTENIGTLFDPLPSQVQGNVHSLTDPDEPVLGFVGATTEVSQRLFINRHSLPPDWHSRNEGYETCTETSSITHDSIRGLNMYEEFADTTYRVPINEIRTRTGDIIGFSYQSTACVDCRLRGTNKKPSFWP
ncbi:DUF4249 domain-containing protein [Hymenobacter sp. HSC-4F20]|uniref:DUF4249 domain-containing protein n=1 Tax=Hymenobacter sp. HSC-4F20 TaxID=2864135 RepID=UPI001C738F88|nr:DUF4249 domain-containing protein [Hymenobacter sp. HSC-4F20]MBX0292676.1 DUF4249 domain-containing protein [Hymenobacter sp. HSC-4F20]